MVLRAELNLDPRDSREIRAVAGEATQFTPRVGIVACGADSATERLDNAYRNAVRLFREDAMPVETTYTSLRERLAAVLDQVANDQEVVIVRRRGAKDGALVPAGELASLMETAHLLRSPRNARRLLAALRRAAGAKSKPESVDKLRREVGLGAAR